MDNEQLEKSVVEALKNGDEWERLVTTQDAHRIRHILTHLRARVRVQHEERRGWVSQGRWTEADYGRWQGTVAPFSAAINRRLSQIEPIARELKPETKNFYTKRHAYDTGTIAALVKAINAYLDDETVSVSVLEDALDITRDFGPEHGEVTLFDALAAGLFDNAKPPRYAKDTEPNTGVAQPGEGV